MKSSASDLARLRPCEGIVPRFIFQMLQSDSHNRLAFAAVGTTRMELSIAILEKVRYSPPTHQSRTRSHRRGVERCGCPHRIPGATHRQETPPQARRHAGIAYRQKTPAGVQRGVGRSSALARSGTRLIGLTYKPSDDKMHTVVLVLRSSNIFERALPISRTNVFRRNRKSPKESWSGLVTFVICVRNGSRDQIGKCGDFMSETQGMILVPSAPYSGHHFTISFIAIQIRRDKASDTRASRSDDQSDHE